MLPQRKHEALPSYRWSGSGRLKRWEYGEILDREEYRWKHRRIDPYDQVGDPVRPRATMEKSENRHQLKRLDRTIQACRDCANTKNSCLLLKGKWSQCPNVVAYEQSVLLRDLRYCVRLGSPS
jgi:hypothetical protein